MRPGNAALTVGLIDCCISDGAFWQLLLSVTLSLFCLFPVFPGVHKRPEVRFSAQPVLCSEVEETLRPDDQPDGVGTGQSGLLAIHSDAKQ